MCFHSVLLRRRTRARVSLRRCCCLPDVAFALCGSCDLALNPPWTWTFMRASWSSAMPCARVWYYERADMDVRAARSQYRGVTDRYVSSAFAEGRWKCQLMKSRGKGFSLHYALENIVNPSRTLEISTPKRFSCVCSRTFLNRHVLFVNDTIILAHLCGLLVALVCLGLSIYKSISCK
jgi:hypothetical protein